MPTSLYLLIVVSVYVASATGQICAPLQFEFDFVGKLDEVFTGSRKGVLSFDSLGSSYIDYKQLRSTTIRELYTNGKLYQNLTFTQITDRNQVCHTPQCRFTWAGM